MMSKRAELWFGRYVAARKRETEGTTEEQEALHECLLLKGRLEDTHGHVEHEIIVDEIIASLEPVAAPEETPSS